MKVKCYDKDNSKTHVEISRVQLTVCRVCGFNYIDYYPWGESGSDPDFSYCDCCGVEFGYQDSGLESIQRFRQDWIVKGAPWDRPEEKPNGWSLEEALANIPDAFK